MNKFQKQLLQDIHQTFANKEEFFQEHTVNGKRMLIMVDENENLNRTKFQKEFHEGIQAERMLIYVKASDFGRKPAHGSKVTIDGMAFSVSSALNEYGMYSITLEAARGLAR